jgi:hypothetical protein
MKLPRVRTTLPTSREPPTPSVLPQLAAGVPHMTTVVCQHVPEIDRAHR